MARISGMILGIGLLIVLSSLASPAGAWDVDDDDGRPFRRHFYDRDDDDDFRYHNHYGIRRGRGYGYGRGSIFTPLIVPRRSFYGGYPDHYYPQAPVQPYYQPAPQYQYTYPQAPVQPYYTQPVQPQPVAPAPVPDAVPDPVPDAVPEPLPPEALSPTSYPAQPELTVPPAPPAEVPPVPPVAAPVQDRPGQFVDVAPALYPYVRIKEAEKVPGYAVHRILAVRSPDPRIPGCVYVKVCVPPGPCRGMKVEKGGAEIELKYNHFEVEVTSAKGVVTIDYDD